MREIGGVLALPESAHNLAKRGRPPPLVFAAMLGLTRRLGQANADRGTYDFSLAIPFPYFFEALDAHLPERRQSVNNTRSTLAAVWRIAAPYFRSEDKWAGRGLLAAVIVIELLSVFLTVLFNR